MTRRDSFVPTPHGLNYWLRTQYLICGDALVRPRCLLYYGHSTDHDPYLAQATISQYNEKYAKWVRQAPTVELREVREKVYSSVRDEREDMIIDLGRIPR